VQPARGLTLSYALHYAHECSHLSERKIVSGLSGCSKPWWDVLIGATILVFSIVTSIILATQLSKFLVRYRWRSISTWHSGRDGWEILFTFHRRGPPYATTPTVWKSQTVSLFVRSINKVRSSFPTKEGKGGRSNSHLIDDITYVTMWVKL